MKTKTQISFAEANQRLCFRYTDSTFPLLPKSEISSLLSSSVVVQPGLCRTWLETPKTGFLTTQMDMVVDLGVALKAALLPTVLSHSNGALSSDKFYL